MEEKKIEFPYKKFPFIVAGISLLVLLFELVLPVFKGAAFLTGVPLGPNLGNAQVFAAAANYFLLPVICFQFIPFGVYLLRNVKGKLKYLGIASIVFAFLSCAIVMTVVSCENRFFVNLIAPLIPFDGDDFCWATLFEILLGEPIISTTFHFYQGGLAFTFWFGTAVFFLFPKKALTKILKREVDKNSNIRYAAAVFVAPLIVVIAIILTIALFFWLIGKITVGAVENAGSSSTTEDTRNYKTVQMEGVKRVSFTADGRFLRDEETGREYAVYNFHRTSGYLEDENGNIYYFDEFEKDGDNFYYSGKHRAYGQTEYQADVMNVRDFK